jgi:DNA-directed RNA polymerase specialized sigma24 family protein
MLYERLRRYVSALIDPVRRSRPGVATFGADRQAPDRPQLLGLDIEPRFDGLYEAGESELYRQRLASMRPFVLEVFLRVTVDKQQVPLIAEQLGLSRRTVRRLLREAVRIISTGDI